MTKLETAIPGQQDFRKEKSPRIWSDRTELAVMMVLLVIGAVMRLYHLSWSGLWTDEATVMHWMVRAPFFAFSHDLSGASTDWLFRQPLVKIHPSAWMARLPSVFAGVASLAVLYRVMRSFYPRAALAVLAVACLAPTHLRYSQEARYYIFVYLSVVICWWTFEHLLERRTRWAAAWAALGFALPALSTPTGVSASWLLAFWYGVLIWKKSGVLELRRWGSAVVAGNLLALPGYLFVLSISRKFAEGGKLVFEGAEDTAIQAFTPGLFRDAAVQSVFGTFAHMDTTVITWVSALTFLFLALGAFASIHLGAVRSLLLLTGALLPTAAIFWISIGRNIPHIRYLMPSIPFAHALIGIGIVSAVGYVARLFQQVAKMPRSTEHVQYVAVVLMVAWLIPGIRQYYSDPKYSFNHTAQIFREIIREHPRTYLVFPTLNHNGAGSRAYSIMQFYIATDPVLEKQVRFVDPAPTTATTFQQFQELDPSPDALFLGAMFHYMAGEREPHWDSLAENRMGYQFRQHDARRYFIVEGRTLAGMTPPEYDQGYLKWLRWIEQKLPADSLSRAPVTDDKLRLLMRLKKPEFQAEIQAAEDYLLSSSPSANQTADILMRRGQLAAAEPMLRREIHHRKQYWFTYVQLSMLLEKRFIEERNIKHLYESLSVLDDARQNAPDVQEWVASREVSLSELLKEAKLVEAVLYREQRQKKSAAGLREELKKTSGRLSGWLATAEKPQPR